LLRHHNQQVINKITLLETYLPMEAKRLWQVW